MATATEEVSNPLREEFEVHQPDQIGYLNVLVYGQPGSGKTFFGGTAQDSPLTSPLLVLDVEGGTTTLRSKPTVDVIQIRSIAELVKVHRTLTEKDHPYKTVMLDSLTELQKLDMRDIMFEVVQRRPDLDPDVPSMREWGKSSEHMRRIIRGFRDLKCNVIMTALMQIEKDANNVTTYYPSLPGKLKGEVPGFLDIVGYLYTIIENDETKRRLQLLQSQKVVAKDRTDSLGDYLDNPTIPDMWDKIKATN